jgi:hypothetical protein
MTTTIRSSIRVKPFLLRMCSSPAGWKILAVRHIAERILALSGAGETVYKEDSAEVL